MTLMIRTQLEMLLHVATGHLNNEASEELLSPFELHAVEQCVHDRVPTFPPDDWTPEASYIAVLTTLLLERTERYHAQSCLPSSISAPPAAPQNPSAFSPQVGSRIDQIILLESLEERDAGIDERRRSSNFPGQVVCTFQLPMLYKRTLGMLHRGFDLANRVPFEQMHIRSPGLQDSRRALLHNAKLVKLLYSPSSGC
ncbi:uncharacterized protein BT62DRAFT_920142 [Guyanagaster necrorhizus]|uniref:Uncharacterized protein n=1 Tax=Guyanagaster necrorhizus TaxID=856835 RepID=A0A9P8ASH0_9AGAR|nr:uncharacterized protein BT62DRAFT_920142 [Guyanagaster necrorhizus MCA 3950]KAG7446105.1 hypothetical protein BT62DRAFT_920142 [Guyanagaster necrorhizus MCA 3950]